LLDRFTPGECQRYFAASGCARDTRPDGAA
jgi:hypothetical protein